MSIQQGGDGLGQIGTGGGMGNGVFLLLVDLQLGKETVDLVNAVVLG